MLTMTNLVAHRRRSVHKLSRKKGFSAGSNEIRGQKKVSQEVSKNSYGKSARMHMAFKIQANVNITKKQQNYSFVDSRSAGAALVRLKLKRCVERN